ncbi:mRNA guanylyltransferase [Angomonas deanei]|uniref:mRNA capping enzyme, catalytic domain containing protein, putative n=1 Tax=Angomonas deanei TaxID=59799 RepID=A0A7G2CC51_9TRYP|nr:mRNA guanylyltransferase [Angomonas deanei]CAD2216303.1 mRNA capping enzyme, catalytic domain containing protein, putative [Angomonas deanei]|eukprot:EPY22380.1 mRNA guanylyltransferase [Angomonas deanei]
MVLETSRFMEQQAQSVAAELAYRPAGCLHEIDCLDKSAEAVSAEIFSIIDRTYPNHVRKVLPEPSIIPRVATHFPLLDDHKTFECLCQEVHQCIGNTWRADASPLSVIGGYVDETCFTDPAKVDLMAAMHVTPKVDGNRVLVVQHKHFGFIAFPFSFAACYNVNVLFDQLEFPNPKEFITTKIPKNTSQSIDILLDAELLVTEKGPTLFIIDFLYLHGVSGKRLPFDKRYLKLIKWFDLIKKKTPKPVMEACRLILKEYTPIDLLPELLPRLEDSSYPIDGIIFQHNDGYHCGLDKKLLKWKPQEDCTVDFRLMNGVFEKNRWTFDVYTTHTSSDKKVSEEPFPGAKAVLSEQEVVQNGIRDSSVCELFLSSKELVGDKVLSTWTFFRTRTDKIRPNKDGIVQEIINMKHLKYDQLCELCSQVEYNGEL